MKTPETWNREILIACAIGTAPCGDEDVDLIGVSFYADNGDCFAHGHLQLDEAEEFLAVFALNVAEMRKRAGRRLS